MNNIIDFKQTKEDCNFNILEQDIFNIFMIYKHLIKDYFDIDLDLLMQSLSKYADIEIFHEIYKNLNIKKDNNDKLVVDLTRIYDGEIKKKTILEYPNEPHHFCIIATEEYLENLKLKYNENILYLFDRLMFYINQDLEYGLDGWNLVAEDEYIKIPKYPGVVTGEFIGQKKDKKIFKKIRKKAIEKLNI